MSEPVEELNATDQKVRLKRRRILSISIIFIAVTAFVVFSKYGLWTRYSLEHKKTTLVNQMDELGLYQDTLRTDIRKLQYDTLEIERIAREQYGMVKPGEKVFIIKKEDK